MIDFEEMWGEADMDGNYKTATAAEIFKFVMMIEKVSFEHFILDHED